MKLSKKQSKINRGLLLGGILVLIVVLYTVITALTFRFQKADIRAVVSGFVNEVAALQAEKGSDAEKKDAFAEILSKYVASKGLGSDDSSYDRWQLQNDYSEFLALVDGDVQVSEITVRFDEDNPDKNFSIVRAGVSYAKVMLNVRVDCKMDMPQIMYECGAEFDSILYMPGSMIEKANYKDAEGDDTVRHYSGSFDYDVTIIMQKSGGEWKVIAVECLYLWGNMAEEREAGGGN